MNTLKIDEAMVTGHVSYILMCTHVEMQLCGFSSNVCVCLEGLAVSHLEDSLCSVPVHSGHKRPCVARHWSESCMLSVSTQKFSNQRNAVKKHVG